MIRLRLMRMNLQRPSLDTKTTLLNGKQSGKLPSSELVRWRPRPELPRRLLMLLSLKLPKLNKPRLS